MSFFFFFNDAMPQLELNTTHSSDIYNNMYIYTRLEVLGRDFTTRLMNRRIRSRRPWILRDLPPPPSQCPISTTARHHPPRSYFSKRDIRRQPACIPIYNYYYRQRRLNKIEYCNNRTIRTKTAEQKNWVISINGVLIVKLQTFWMAKQRNTTFRLFRSSSDGGGVKSLVFNNNRTIGYINNIIHYRYDVFLLFHEPWESVAQC